MIEIKITDEIKCTILGLHKKTLEQLSNKFSLYVEGYKFTAAYKVGAWDGKKAFINYKGETYVYLIPKIVKYLKQLGFTDFNIKDLRKGRFYDVNPEDITKDYFKHIIHKKTGNPYKLKDHQLEGAKALIDAGNGIGLACTSFGKAQPLYSKILTPDGWKLMGDIKPNDLIITPKNTISKVLNIFPQGITDVYKVSFYDGGEMFCSPEHLFKIYNIKWLDGKKQPFELLTAERIKELLETKKYDIYVPSIPLPIDVKKYDYNIPPYFAGSILPFAEIIDDKLIINEIRSSSRYHSEISINDVIDTYINYGIKVKLLKYLSYELISTDESSEKLLNAVKSFLNNKASIPNEYVLCDSKDRLKFIQGMCDIGGNITANGKMLLYIPNHHLKPYIIEMLLLQGCTMDNNTFEHNSRISNSIYFSHRNPLAFFTNDKIEIFKKYAPEYLGDLNAISKNRKIKNIEYHGKEETQCILIEDKDHLYITDDCIITHNTILNAALVDAYAKKGAKTLTIVPATSLVKQTVDQFKELELDVHNYTSKTPSINHDHIVATWQTLQHVPHIVSQFQMIVVDECLDGNTLITMADGFKKCIKDIVENDKVLNYNESSKQFEVDIVVKVHKNLLKSSDEKMYQLDFDDGTILKCTGNHMILTDVGYVRADCLNDSHEILNY